MRVTLDTNVYVSALNFGGRSAYLIGMAQARIIRIDLSDHIEAELVRVLREDDPVGHDNHSAGGWPCRATRRAAAPS